jgi:hypothetical protein
MKKKMGLAVEAHPLQWQVELVCLVVQGPNHRGPVAHQRQATSAESVDAAPQGPCLLWASLQVDAQC